MARTNSPAVTKLLGRDYDAERKPNLDVHIASANVVVSRTISGASPAVDSATAELMERWVAAWFYTKNDPTYSQRSTLSASGSFNRGPDAYLEGAVAVDPTGDLDAEARGQTSGGQWIGKNPVDQTDFIDRDGGF